VLLAALAALLAAEPGTLEALRGAVFDGYQKLAPRERTNAPVTIVEIDERALRERGQWPWPRTLLAELVARIAEHKPAALGIDMLFPEPDRLSPDALARHIPNLPADLADRLQRLPSNDARLAEAIRGNNVVLAVAGLENVDPRFAAPPAAPPVRIRTAHERLRSFAGHLASVGELDQAAAGRGLVSTDTSARIVRRVPLVAKVRDVVVPSLALELWRIASGASHLELRDGATGMLAVSFGDVSIPLQRDGTLWLRYSGHQPARFVSAADVLAGRADSDALSSKLVLVGLTGVGLLDYQANALGEGVPGVELHAELIEQIYDGVYLQRPSWLRWLELALLLAGGAILIALVPASRVAVSSAVFLALIAALAAAGWAAFAGGGLLLDPAAPAMGLVAVFLLLLAITYAQADRQRRALREEAARAAGELEAARRIQLGLLPDPGALFGGERAIRLQALIEPARSVGGDFYDCFKLDASRLFFVVGDVSGKGMPAALFMALAQATLRAAAIGAGADAGAILLRAAAEIARHNSEQLFVTVFAGVLDLENGGLNYCNAGHEPPYVRPPQGALERLPHAQRPPIGVLDSAGYATESRQLANGEWLCVVTDGVTEAMSESGELYGAERLGHALQSVGATAGPAEIIAAVREDVRRFVGQAPASDDFTLLALRWS
jgi:serine phosphatase RsbU (regulator of sigma subunit)